MDLFPVCKGDCEICDAQESKKKMKGGIALYIHGV